MKQAVLGGLPQEDDALADVGGGFRAEPRQLGEAAILRRHVELGERLDSQGAVDLADLRDPESRNAQHFHQAGRDLLAQLVEHARPPRRHQLAHDFERVGPDPFHLRQRTGFHAAGDVAREPRERPGGVLVGLDPEARLALQLKKGRDLLEGLPGGLFIHR